MVAFGGGGDQSPAGPSNSVPRAEVTGICEDKYNNRHVLGRETKRAEHEL